MKARRTNVAAPPVSRNRGRPFGVRERDDQEDDPRDQQHERREPERVARRRCRARSRSRRRSPRRRSRRAPARRARAESRAASWPLAATPAEQRQPPDAEGDEHRAEEEAEHAAAVGRGDREERDADPDEEQRERRRRLPCRASCSLVDRRHHHPAGRVLQHVVDGAARRPHACDGRRSFAARR